VSAEALFGPEPLEPRHDVSSFGCGVPALDDYLIDRALTDARAGKSQTQVACRGDSVVAYYSLAAGSVPACGGRLAAASGSDGAATGVVFATSPLRWRSMQV